MPGDPPRWLPGRHAAGVEKVLVLPDAPRPHRKSREQAKAREQGLGRPFKLTPHEWSEPVRRRERGET
jgi:hypothetical protein